MRSSFRTLLCCKIVFLAAVSLPWLGAQGQSSPGPVNPHATPEARALLEFVQSISGNGIITGQHNFPNDASRWTDLTYDLTGKYPGLFGQDFGFSGGEDKDSALSRPAMVAEVERQWKNGAVIALTWHEVRPMDDEPVTFRDSVQGRLTDYEWHDLLTPGTPLYKRWCEQVDVVAGYLKELRDAHVPVLFRPYHEVNGNWFWWGYRPGKDGSAALYRQLYRRFVDVHHLDNLLWVWNVNAPGGAAGPVNDYFPGLEYADLVTMDIYGEFKQEYYESMLSLAAGKPIALAEVGQVPSLDVLAHQPRWAYFMTWSGFLDADRFELPNALYHAPQALNRGDPRLAGPLEKIRSASGDREPRPTVSGANKEAAALLTRIGEGRGKAIHSGQRAHPADNSQAAHEPEILSLDFDPQHPEALLGLAKKSREAHQLLLVNWYPESPAGGKANTPLSDYEWQQLFTAGSELNRHWLDQIDVAARTLRTLQDAGVAVMWNPLPCANESKNWWGGRKGIHGSAALYRMTFERLSELQNLVWIWEASVSGFGPSGPGSPQDYFPGLLYLDALELQAIELRPGRPLERILGGLAASKPFGLDITGPVPTAESLTRDTRLSWFILASAATGPANAESVRQIYASPNVISLPGSCKP